MANVDVTPLMYDPDFVDPIVVIRRQTTVNDFGENVTTECTYNFIGSVQPASGKALSRLPDGLQVADVTSFWIKGPITVSGAGKYPDILVFRGKRFQVRQVNDWTNFGVGWSEGLCVAEKPDGST